MHLDLSPESQKQPSVKEGKNERAAVKALNQFSDDSISVPSFCEELTM